MTSHGSSCRHFGPPTPAFNPVNPFYGLGQQGQGNAPQNGARKTPFSGGARVPRVALLFQGFSERLRQSFQDQIGRLDDPLIPWTQIRFECFTRQVLQTNDIANSNFITLLGRKLHVGILDHATSKFL